MSTCGVTGVKSVKGWAHCSLSGDNVPLDQSDCEVVGSCRYELTQNRAARNRDPVVDNLNAQNWSQAASDVQDRNRRIAASNLHVKCCRAPGRTFSLAADEARRDWLCARRVNIDCPHTARWPHGRAGWGSTDRVSRTANIGIRDCAEDKHVSAQICP